MPLVREDLFAILLFQFPPHVGMKLHVKWLNFVVERLTVASEAFALVPRPPIVAVVFKLWVVVLGGFGGFWGVLGGFGGFWGFWGVLGGFEGFWGFWGVLGGF